MTKQQAMKEHQDSAEFELKKFADQCETYPGHQGYAKLCEVFWKHHHRKMEKLKRLPDNVESGTSDSDEKSQCQDTSADTTKRPMKSEKKSCKRLACMATPRKQ